MQFALHDLCDTEVWEVLLRDHKPYVFVCLQRAFAPEAPLHQVILVDAAKLLACADRDATDYVLPLVQHWHAGKRNGIRDLLDPAQPNIPEMPLISFKRRKCRSFLGLMGLEREGVVSFRNGQHRARYLAFAGATCFPVEILESEAAMLALYCCTTDAPGVRWWPA